MIYSASRVGAAAMINSYKFLLPQQHLYGLALTSGRPMRVDAGPVDTGTVATPRDAVSLAQLPARVAAALVERCPQETCKGTDRAVASKPARHSLAVPLFGDDVTHADGVDNVNASGDDDIDGSTGCRAVNTVPNTEIKCWLSSSLTQEPVELTCKNRFAAVRSSHPICMPSNSDLR
jgi:hypothetical protein